MHMLIKQIHELLLAYNLDFERTNFDFNFGVSFISDN